MDLDNRPAWQRTGEEPDYRFSLANERTFLAWIRTALALLAGGVLLEQFAGRRYLHGLVVACAIGLCILAAVLCAMAYFKWRDNEIAMRHARPLPYPRAIFVLSLGGLAAAILIVILMALA